MDVTATRESTRRALHGLAELVLAGPQYRASGTIRLRVVSDGFATVAAPDLRVEGAYLVAGERRLALRDTSYHALAAAAGVTAGAPAGLYRDGSGVRAEEPVVLDAAAAAHAARCLGLGDAALRRLAAEAGAPAGTVPVLWPEHFDVALTLDEVDYGVSLGDAHVGEPYAYVGPWRARQGAFWNQPFGAARTLRELADLDGVLAFLAEGRGRAAAGG
jgi:hypothetical protein